MAVQSASFLSILHKIFQYADLAASVGMAIPDPHVKSISTLVDLLIQDLNAVIPADAHTTFVSAPAPAAQVETVQPSTGIAMVAPLQAPAVNVALADLKAPAPPTISVTTGSALAPTVDPKADIPFMHVNDGPPAVPLAPPVLPEIGPQTGPFSANGPFPKPWHGLDRATAFQTGIHVTSPFGGQQDLNPTDYATKETADAIAIVTGGVVLQDQMVGMGAPTQYFVRFADGTFANAGLYAEAILKG